MMTNKLLAGLAPVHPGEVLKEDVLPTLSISKTDFAKALGLSRQSLYDILNGRLAINPAVALRLARMIGGSAEMWMALQAEYDLALTRELIGKELDELPKLVAA